MFQGFSQETLDFMWGIRFNNEKSWFELHKQEYLDHLYDPMRSLANDVYAALREDLKKYDTELHISRIYRDARRLHGRGPYKDHLWFSIRGHAGEWTSTPVFWFELDPESWSYGLGYYAARAATMDKLRRRIQNQPQKLRKLDRLLDAQQEFVLAGDEYKKIKISPDPALQRWYNKKNLALEHDEALTEDLYSPGLASRVAEGFRLLMPFFAYLSTLDGDPEAPVL